MYRVLSILLTLLLLASLFACGKAEPGATTTGQPEIIEPYDIADGKTYESLAAPAQGYDEVVQRFREITQGSEGLLYAECVLYDMDGDGQPELLVTLCPHAVAGGHWFVYTMQAGKARFVADFSGNQAALYTCDEGGIYRVWGPTGSGGHEEVYKITKQGNTLAQTTVIAWRPIGDGDYYEPPDGAYIEAVDIAQFALD